MKMRICALLAGTLGTALLSGCGEAGTQDRQPSVAEVKAYTAKIERDEAAAKADAVRKSRAKEEVRDEEHRAKVPAQN